MLEVLTGTGLAASAGMNAYIPLLTVGLLSKYTDLIELPAGWDWLSDGRVLIALAVLLAIELVADKVPVVDSVNDVVQTVVRPTAGGLAFGAASTSETTAVSEPSSFLSNHQWFPILLGIVISLAVHLAKALTRPVVNALSAGIAAPMISATEDLASLAGSFVAIVLPILVLLFLVGMVVAIWWLLRRRRERRRSTQLL